MTLRILILDDEANIRKTLSYCLTEEGHEVAAVGTPAAALAAVRDRTYDLLLLDLRLRDADGMDLIPVLHAESPWMKIIIITAHATIETAVEAMRRGATDYLSKPFTPEQVRSIARGVARVRELENQVAALMEDRKSTDTDFQPDSRSPAMMKILQTARDAAPSDAIVLLRGESGTGKSMLARGIHCWSPRAKKPFSVFSCPSIPGELFESELFGHVRGAFTGAVRESHGRIAACEGGTLFLDEIGDLPPAIQAKLLRVIQDREYERIGESFSRKADVRIIAATNADLEARVRDGRFREDLYYRLNVIQLVIPPLRERAEDILPLAADFLGHFQRVNHRRLLGFSPGAEALLARYDWPGNVRELRNAVERAVILGHDERVGEADLPLSSPAGEGELRPGDAATLEAVEREHIRKVLRRAPSLQEAAAILGIDQATLWRKRKQMDL
jgi:NtrC-family two-component system response regulator AlgB